jgi:hypothetical protein
MSGPTRVDLSARISIMMLLTDQETARVTTAEAGARIADGEEFLDLEQLERGIQSAASRTPLAMGHIMPRSAVGNDTWKRIVTHRSS